MKPIDSTVPVPLRASLPIMNIVVEFYSLLMPVFGLPSRVLRGISSDFEVENRTACGNPKAMNKSRAESICFVSRKTASKTNCVIGPARFRLREELFLIMQQLIFITKISDFQLGLAHLYCNSSKRFCERILSKLVVIDQRHV